MVRVVERRSFARRAAGLVYRTVKRTSGINSLHLPADEAKSITPPSDLADLFYAHGGRPIHKWTHYFAHYEQFFTRFRNTPVKMLEIGVFKGGSLELWRNYFGHDATIFGIDINPSCANFVDAPNQVRIGSQDDPNFLRSVVQEMGGLDIVLDDGSHRGNHIISSFRTLFPLLSDGGLYVMEAEFPGTRQNQSLSFVKRLIDDMHCHFHRQEPLETPHVGAVHLFDSMAFIEKNERHRTGHTCVPA